MPGSSDRERTTPPACIPPPHAPRAHQRCGRDTLKFAHRKELQSRVVAAGFTAIELLVVVSIVGVLAAIAGPSFAPLIASQRASSAATDLYVALATARSEATKRNADVTLSQKSS